MSDDENKPRLHVKVVGDGTLEGTKVIDLKDGKELPVSDLSISMNEGYSSMHIGIHPELVEIEAKVLVNEKDDPSWRAHMRIKGMDHDFRGNAVYIKVDPLIAWFAGLMQRQLKDAREKRKYFPRYSYHQGLLEITKEVADAATEDHEYWALRMADIGLQCAFQADLERHGQNLGQKDRPPQEEN